ncbi:MAG: 1-deoxy-D-xylulose-5-phosphate reductoisomerase [Ignavibacteriales bacterium]|nr:1-deoxy-D-xylulose-5-phosphate reductoisomerase [Ignavibacteriales bacterium]
MAKKKNICILGSTGSIGANSLDVIARFPDKFNVQTLGTKNNINLLEKQIMKFHPKTVVVFDEIAAKSLRQKLKNSVRVLSGTDGLKDIVSAKDVDIVINSLVGFAGLHPTLEAIKHGKTVALANKESLVVAGELIMPMVKKYNASLIPIDSEHSAIMQCLIGESFGNVNRIILTASGGPFLNTTKNNFSKITIKQALNHPNWSMGSKITIDSATMMNKGLEVIEARWLFNLPPEKIDVLIHPQSIIHSMVEFVDGSIKAQLGVPDMRIPIQYALTYPQRFKSNNATVDFFSLGQMTFFKPDKKKFRCLQLAYDAIKIGGTMPAVLNAANEVAVEKFLSGKLPFHKIPTVISTALDKIKCVCKPTLSDIEETDRAARDVVLSITR